MPISGSDGGPDGGAGDHHVDRADLDLLHHVAFLAQLVVGEVVDPDGVAHGRLEVGLQALVPHVVRGVVVRHHRGGEAQRDGRLRADEGRKSCRAASDAAAPACTNRRRGIETMLCLQSCVEGAHRIVVYRFTVPVYCIDLQAGCRSGFPRPRGGRSARAVRPQAQPAVGGPLAGAREGVAAPSRHLEARAFGLAGAGVRHFRRRSAVREGGGANGGGGGGSMMQPVRVAASRTAVQASVVFIRAKCANRLGRNLGRS